MRRAISLSPLTVFPCITTCKGMGRPPWFSSMASVATVSIGTGKWATLRYNTPWELSISQGMARRDRHAHSGPWQHLARMWWQWWGSWGWNK